MQSNIIVKEKRCNHTGFRRALQGESSNSNVFDGVYSPFSHGRFGSSLSHNFFSSFKKSGLFLFSIVVNPVMVQCDWSCTKLEIVAQGITSVCFCNISKQINRYQWLLAVTYKGSCLISQQFCMVTNVVHFLYKVAVP